MLTLPFFEVYSSIKLKLITLCEVHLNIWLLQVKYLNGEGRESKPGYLFHLSVGLFVYLLGLPVKLEY